MTASLSPDAFMAKAQAPPPAATTGNTEWAVWMASEARRVVAKATEYNPRSRQVHLGPSELGTPCDRQIVGKLVREPQTNHVSDPWPSFVGTALHASLADAFELDNRLYVASGQPARWFTERRVVPHPDHAGTGDLYDVSQRAVLDHKCLGDSSMAKVQSAAGPSRKYRVQLALYALGFAREGFPVERLGLIAYPRTRSSINGIYVWEAPFDADTIALLAEVFTQTAHRKAMAAQVAAGTLALESVPRDPEGEDCYFCPFYRPEGGSGCPGTKMA